MPTDEPVAIHIPQAALDAVDLFMPDELKMDQAAQQAVVYLGVYHKTNRELKAARQNDDSQRINELSKLLKFARDTVAITQYEFIDHKEEFSALCKLLMDGQVKSNRLEKERAGQ